MSLSKIVKRITTSSENNASQSDLDLITKNTVEVDSFEELKRLFNWNSDPVFTDKEYLRKYYYSLDVNDRKLRDAESVCGIVANSNAKVCLEIGTAQGHMTAFMADNAPKGIVHTVNIHPDEIKQGGELVTFAPSLDEIGNYYRSKNKTNIKQIIANTATWEPNIGTIDVAFIDGSHDTEFVYNDTKKILKHCKKGSFILWHDYNLDLVGKHDWIHSVCLGVEKLYKEGIIKGEIFHIKNSWVGIYQVK